MQCLIKEMQRLFSRSDRSRLLKMPFSMNVILAVLTLCIVNAHCRAPDAPRGERDASGTAGEDRSGSTASPRESRHAVCSFVKTAIINDAILDGEILDRYKVLNRRHASTLFYDKPITTFKHSVCAGVKSTCCTPIMEKELPIIVFKEYREIYHSVLATEYYQTCPTVGRRSYYSMRQSLQEAKRLLSIEIHSSLNTTLPINSEVLDEFFDYLIQFFVVPDLCPLRWKVRQIVEEVLLTSLINTVFNDDSDIEIDRESISTEQLECFRNISNPYVAEFTDQITSDIHKLLIDYKTYVESLQLASKVITALKYHRFSPACVAALTRMKHCAFCSGHSRFPPCLDFCINTLTGCFADVSEVYTGFKSFVSAVQRLSREIHPSLEANSLIRNQLRGFVAMIPDFQHQSNVDYLASRDCSPINTGEETTDSSSSSPVHDRSRRSRFSQPINTDHETSGTSFNPNLELSDNSISRAFSTERGCLETFQELLMGIPQEMCYLSKTHAITNVLNQQCWTGTGLGDYNQPLVGRSKSEQVNNTAFATHHLETTLVYEELILELNETTVEIETALEYRDTCSDSDDEDCVRPVVMECTGGSGSGSGFGSGSGSGSGRPSSGYGDLEQGPVSSTQSTRSSLPNQNEPERNQPGSEEFSQFWPVSDEEVRQNQSSNTFEEAPTDEGLGTIGMIEIVSQRTTQETVSSTTEATTEAVVNEVSTGKVAEDTEPYQEHTSQGQYYTDDDDNSSAAVSLMTSFCVVWLLSILTVFFI